MLGSLAFKIKRNFSKTHLTASVFSKFLLIFHAKEPSIFGKLHPLSTVWQPIYYTGRNDSKSVISHNYLTKEEFWCKMSSTYPKVAQIPLHEIPFFPQHLSVRMLILDHVIHEVKISGKVGPCCGFTSCNCKNWAKFRIVKFSNEATTLSLTHCLGIHSCLIFTNYR